MTRTCPNCLTEQAGGPDCMGHCNNCSFTENSSDPDDPRWIPEDYSPKEYMRRISVLEKDNKYQRYMIVTRTQQFNDQIRKNNSNMTRNKDRFLEAIGLEPDDHYISSLDCKKSPIKHCIFMIGEDEDDYCVFCNNPEERK